jgi:hypothetical protein
MIMGGHGPAIPDDSPGCDAEVHQHAAGTAVSMHRWAALCGMPAPAGARHPYFHPGQAPENRHACKEPLPPSQSVLNKSTDVNEHWRLGVVRPACTHPSHNRYPALKVRGVFDVKQHTEDTASRFWLLACNDENTAKHV